MQAVPKPVAAAVLVPERHGGENSLEVFFVDLAKSEAFLDAEERETPRLSEADIRRAKLLDADNENQRMWRAGRIATRIVLERRGGSSIRNIDFEIEANGRPTLGPGGPYFNVSHSGGAALIAVSSETPVGVDLEGKRPLAISEDRRQRIVAAVGRLTAEPLLRADSDDDILIAWVRLEAAAKALGTGIGRLLTEEGVIGGRREERVHHPTRTLEIKSLVVAADYTAAIAAERLPERIDVLPFPAADLRDFISRK